GTNIVIVLNDLQRQAVLRAGIDGERIVKIPHFVEVDDDVPARRQEYALCVARLVVEKGVGDAIRACASANVPLKILGDGPLRQELEHLAASVGADVEFLGQVPQEVVLQEMRRAGAVVVPSIWHEVSALVLTQAMSTHAPVIATATGGTPELVGDGRGFLYQPGDVAELAERLRAVIDQPAMGSAVAARAAAFARVELTRDRWLERMQGTYARFGLSL
ncbi:MAG TPA: glycosyltransferase family 4 protein, partial [Acidimicrobiales bacterium]